MTLVTKVVSQKKKKSLWVLMTVWNLIFVQVFFFTHSSSLLQCQLTSFCLRLPLAVPPRDALRSNECSNLLSISCIDDCNLACKPLDSLSGSVSSTSDSSDTSPLDLSLHLALTIMWHPPHDTLINKRNDMNV